MQQQPPGGWGPPPGPPQGHYPPPHHGHYPPPQYGQTPDMQLAGLIAPVNVRNGMAFVSGYLGLGALLCFGPVLGVPAIITGAMALKKPELGGQGRAWAGIVMGTIGTLWGLAFLVFRLSMGR